MIPSIDEPIHDEWTGIQATYLIEPPVGATVVELAHTLGPLDLHALEPVHAELAAVVAELAARANRSWVIDPDEPLAALLRMVALLATESPGARSVAAHFLIGAVSCADGDQLG